MAMEDRIREAVGKALAKMGVLDATFAIEWPGDETHGDYATNVAMAAYTYVENPPEGGPKAFAEELLPHIREALGTYVDSVEVAGPGFINFRLSPGVVREEIARVVGAGERYGAGNEAAGKRIIIEYTDPNPFKEMHIGHLMSNVIGESIARLIENNGATITRACYQGDVGPHVAKALWGLRDAEIVEPGNAAELGKAYAHGAAAYEKSEKAKAEITVLNQALYAGDDTALMELWRKGRDISLEAFEEIYKTLGTKFDYYFFESECSAPGVAQVEKNTPGVFTKSQGAVIYEGERKGLHTLVFITSQGTPTYEAKEIGLAFLKEERWPTDESYILTAAEQVGHFKVVKAALAEIAPTLGTKTHHIPHGFLRLTSGKMSSREGTVITAESLINDMVRKAGERNADPLIAEAVALGAIKYMILRQASGGDIVFDPEKSLSLEGDSGPYLQYSYVRAQSVLAQAEEKSSTIYGTADAPTEPYTIERFIIRFPKVVARAERERAPHHLTQYLTSLASEWNSFYAQERIIGGEYENYKLLVAEAFAHTMKRGLSLLGIPSPERM
ncbi:MAG: arginine--tRNA ligase [Minisyncoccia bacterium]